MKYDKQKIFEEALQLIEKHKLVFIADVIAFLPISKATFYLYFPDSSDELDSIKELIAKQRISLSVSMRRKMFDSDNATMSIALYKLICTDEERKLLSTTYQEIDHTTKGDAFKVSFKDFNIDTDTNVDTENE
jgi:hypothetical protein